MMKASWWIAGMFALLVPAAAIAQSEGDIRLVDGPSPSAGRIEVFHDGQWGTVCDDNMDQQDATVVCRQLGFGAPSSWDDDQGDPPQFGAGVGQIWMDNTNCVGNENRLVDCPFAGFGSHNCSHFEDASVVCGSGSAPVPAVGQIGLLLTVAALATLGGMRLRRSSRKRCR